jgi:hypothetical protein
VSVWVAKSASLQMTKTWNPCQASVSAHKT